MISVLIPVFNAEKYLASCLDSVIAQTFKEIEIICVDEGSLDSSLKILESYSVREPRLTVIKQKNKGRSSARNRALAMATGDYVCFLDSDDILPVNSLEELYSHVSNTSEKNFYDAVVGSIEVEYDVHKEMEESDTSHYKIDFNGPRSPSDDLLWNFHCSACACLFKLDTIKRLNLRFPDGLNYEDAYWHWCFFSSCKNIYFTSKVVYKYFRREGSIMSQTFDTTEGKSADHLKIAQRIIEFWKDKNCLEVHKETIPKLLEQYFWFSFKFSPPYERPKITAYLIELLRKYCKTTTLLTERAKQIREGDVGFLFRKSRDEEIFLSIFLRTMRIVDRYIPKQSKIRKITYKFCRLLYRKLS